MRKLILKMSISLDGFVAGPNGETDWMIRSMSDEGKAWIVEALGNVGLLAVGSRTFQAMATYWPRSTDVLAPPMNQIPKAVFSRTGTNIEVATTRALEDARARALPESKPDPQALEGWRSARIVTGDLFDAITRLKQEPGKDIVAFGGVELAQNLASLGVIDEYRLVVHPVAVGKGLPLFSRLTAPVDLELVELKAFKTGTVAHVYRARPTSRAA
ncbi:dihydrofolate reductase family protein [Pendulispora albinea]|uniref:Dihydrofolate reductase family protein n=1 Tax=Pendulispora albinea TaxID=2741071 RepID=A0ABZ2M777_9BACT